MAAINPNNLAKFKGILEIRPVGNTGAYTRLASVRGLVANIDTSNVIDIKADDTGSVYKVTDVQATIEAELLENMGRDTLGMLFTGTSSDVAGVLQSGVTQTVTSGTVTYLDLVEIENQNGDGSAITVNSITGATDGLLTAGTNYQVVQGTDGKYGVIFISSAGITTLAQDFTIDYDYTPNASEDISINIDSTEVKSFDVKLSAVEGGKSRIINFTSAAFSAPYNMNFADIVEQGDITGSSLTFTANKGSLVNYSNEIL